MRISLVLFASVLCVAFSACHGDSPDDWPCAPPSTSTESWPIDPSALQPRPWSSEAAFSPSPHPPFPAVVDTGGGVLPQLRLVSIVAAGDPLHDMLFAFGDSLVESRWLASFAPEYGLAATGTSVHVDGPALTGNVRGSDMKTYVENAVAGLPAGPGPSLYVLYLPPGVSYATNGVANCGCTLIGGAHTTLDDQGDALAYVQRCSASDNDSVTRIASHEVAEAMTDTGHGFRLEPSSPPWSGSVWASAQPPGEVEVGDLCSGTFVTEGSWTYQRIWSNSAAAAGGDPCVPALPTPYFDTSATEDWVPVGAGATATVELTGWSTGPRADWYVYPLVTYPRSGPFTAQLTGATQQSLEGVVYTSINDGGTATLTITVSSDAPSGSWGVVHVISRSADHSDGAHYWPVGVYVP